MIVQVERGLYGARLKLKVNCRKGRYICVAHQIINGTQNMCFRDRYRPLGFGGWKAPMFARIKHGKDSALHYISDLQWRIDDGGVSEMPVSIPRSENRVETEVACNNDCFSEDASSLAWLRGSQFTPDLCPSRVVSDKMYMQPATV